MIFSDDHSILESLELLKVAELRLAVGLDDVTSVRKLRRQHDVHYSADRVFFKLQYVGSNRKPQSHTPLSPHPKVMCWRIVTNELFPDH